VKCLKRITNLKKIPQITNVIEKINARIFPVSQHITLTSDDTYVAIVSAHHSVVTDKVADFHPSKAKLLKVLFNLCFPISERALIFGRFPASPVCPRKSNV